MTVNSDLYEPDGLALSQQKRALPRDNSELFNGEPETRSFLGKPPSGKTSPGKTSPSKKNPPGKPKLKQLSDDPNSWVQNAAKSARPVTAKPSSAAKVIGTDGWLLYDDTNAPRYDTQQCLGGNFFVARPILSRKMQAVKCYR